MMHYDIDIAFQLLLRVRNGHQGSTFWILSGRLWFLYLLAVWVMHLLLQCLLWNEWHIHLDPTSSYSGRTNSADRSETFDRWLLPTKCIKSLHEQKHFLLYMYVHKGFSSPSFPSAALASLKMCFLEASNSRGEWRGRSVSCKGKSDWWKCLPTKNGIAFSHWRTL